MAQFIRRFDRLDALERMLTNSEQGTWWRDLLTLWRPSGQASGTDGLRLAIRNNYMNFYRRGQSVARVGFNKDKWPVLWVHAKYVLPQNERQAMGQEYVVLTSTSLVRPGGQQLPYEGIQTLREWIRTVDEEYGGDEKTFVDDLLSVPENDGVIDLEMALPAWGDVKTAPRMDLVSIAPVNGQPTVFFGEVKLVTDSRLRCRAPVVRDKMPEVLKQLSIYRKYLAVPEHRAQISRQYSMAARVLKRLRDMADAIGPVRSLGTSILQSADEELAVAELARLIVMNDRRVDQRAWADHRTKLESERELVPMIELASPGVLNFSTMQ
jgi:hypothetical protein